MLGRAANFQSEDGSLNLLRIPVFLYASDCRFGLSLCSTPGGKAEKWPVTAHSVGRGRELLLFLVSAVVLERSASWVAVGAQVRVAIENGIIVTIVSSPGKKTASFSLN